MIDLLAHYDTVAELMAATGGRLGNRAGTPNGSASELRQEVFRRQKEKEGGKKPRQESATGCACVRVGGERR